MDKSLPATLLFSCFLLISLSVSSLAQNCSSYSFSRNQIYSACNDLSQLSCSLHWNYHPSNMTADIAFRKTGASTSNWIAWALNPTTPNMAGSQALVAYQQSNSTMLAYTAQVAGSGSMQIGNLSFEVPSISAEYSSGGDMVIFATLKLDNSLVSTNQVWQEGPLSGGSPGPHPTTGENMQSVGTVNFVSGTVTSTGGGTSSKARKRNVHGVLNAVSWGILMPVGIIIARYLKVFKSAGPAWFYLHAICQTSGYAVGVAGWATGIKLGSDSPGITYNTHRKLGITIFALGTLQVLALLLRPKPDHKYRLYWNIYHHTIGYTTVILSIINIFEGFEALDREKNWKKAYIGVLIFLGSVAVVLEAVTWLIVIKRKKTASSDKHVNGVNGYGSRVQQTA
ncbi:cytochrome b561 and DOMON domain-containing protein At4g17280-like [Populus nigra]|uniref:cytochrome b561 and DOMON domain-containing protein At4g17280-like n=1 Tax=Populus nigra TaxID=3691 RepID=UPI002B26B9EF|nr:cytochrome b561 and DOMON domain-containing protein At4g17280-like [Populus nigra]